MTFRAQIKGRAKRLVLTLIAKKYVIWLASIPLLIWVGREGFGEWLLFTAGVIGIDAGQKYVGLDSAYRPYQGE